MAEEDKSLENGEGGGEPKDWKAEARKWESRAKANFEKAKAYDEAQEAGKSELEKARAKAEKLDGELKAMKAKAERDALTAGTSAVTATADPAADLDALVEKVNEDYDISGVALSKAWANALRKLRVAATGARQFPEIPLNLKTGSLDGIAAATSGTVNGKLAKTPTKVLAIMGAGSSPRMRGAL